MRLLTWNIHKGIGGRDRRYAMDRIFDVIEAENPDIVLLQEVDSGVPRSRFHDQPVLLHERLAMRHGLFQLNVALSQGGYGNLLLSRWPIAWHQQISLRWQFKKPRGAQLARIEAPEGHIFVVNWHLGLAEFERQWQIRTLLQHPELERHAALPMIIAGDSNDWRNQLQKTCFEPAGFSQITTPPSKFRSFPAALHVGSLDKAFVRGGIVVRTARVGHGGQTKEASDHLPLIVDFHLSGAVAWVDEELATGLPEAPQSAESAPTSAPPGDEAPPRS